MWYRGNKGDIGIIYILVIINITGMRLDKTFEGIWSTKWIQY